jgi:hypothetical protein
MCPCVLCATRIAGSYMTRVVLHDLRALARAIVWPDVHWLPGIPQTRAAVSSIVGGPMPRCLLRGWHLRAGGAACLLLVPAALWAFFVAGLLLGQSPLACICEGCSFWGGGNKETRSLRDKGGIAHHEMIQCPEAGLVRLEAHQVSLNRDPSGYFGLVGRTCARSTLCVKSVGMLGYTRSTVSQGQTLGADVLSMSGRFFLHQLMHMACGVCGVQCCMKCTTSACLPDFICW